MESIRITNRKSLDQILLEVTFFAARKNLDANDGNIVNIILIVKNLVVSTGELSDVIFNMTLLRRS